MAFGHQRRKRKRQAAEDEKRRLEDERRKKEQEEAQDPAKIGEEVGQIQNEAQKLAEQDKQRQKERRAGDEEDVERLVNKEMQGMSEEHKRALRESANQRVNAQVSSYQRKLASQSGTRGVRGPAAAAPQNELYRTGMEAKNQFERDLIEQDQLVAMQRLAAFLAGLEGRTAEDILRNQQYIDLITGRQAQKKAGYEAGQYGSDYRRV